MKQKKKSDMKIIQHYSKIFVAVAVVSFATHTSWAQDEEAKAPGKMEATIQLSYLKKTDQSKEASVNISATDNGKIVMAHNAHINFYLTDGANPVLLKSVVTNMQGKATVDLPEVLPLDAERYFGIIARIENDSLYADAEEELWHKEAALSLDLQTQDSTKMAVAKLTETDAAGQVQPLVGKDVSFYVQRLFGIMPAAEEFTATTDEEGVASFVFPDSIPGDSEGNVTVVARISDDEDYGNLENKTSGKWGVVLAPEMNPFPRALWAPNAPPALIITLCVIFGGIWFTYGYVFNELRKIDQEKI